MHHAVLLAVDSGESLRPLTDATTPTAFLLLGDRRTLIEQWFERLKKSLPEANVSILVNVQNLPLAKAMLPESATILPHSSEDTLADSMSYVLSQIDTSGDGPTSILFQPAEQGVWNEEVYSQKIEQGFTVSMREGKGISFTASDSAGLACPTGIHILPLPALAKKLRCKQPSALGGDFTSLLLGDTNAVVTMDIADSGWLDVSGWKGMRRLLGHVDKPWGHEELWALGPNYAGKILFIKAGESLSLQYHKTKNETIRLASGRMRLRIEVSAEQLETHILIPGTSFDISPHIVHQMEALEDCTVIEVSTPQLADVVRLHDRYGRNQVATDR